MGRKSNGLLRGVLARSSLVNNRERRFVPTVRVKPQYDSEGAHIPFCNYPCHLGITLNYETCEGFQCSHYRKLYLDTNGSGVNGAFDKDKGLVVVTEDHVRIHGNGSNGKSRPRSCSGRNRIVPVNVFRDHNGRYLVLQDVSGDLRVLKRDSNPVNLSGCAHLKKLYILNPIVKKNKK